jgi:hypothetical protein
MAKPEGTQGNESRLAEQAKEREKGLLDRLR